MGIGVRCFLSPHEFRFETPTALGPQLGVGGRPKKALCCRDTVDRKRDRTARCFGTQPLSGPEVHSRHSHDYGRALATRKGSRHRPRVPPVSRGEGDDSNNADPAPTTAAARPAGPRYGSDLRRRTPRATSPGLAPSILGLFDLASETSQSDVQRIQGVKDSWLCRGKNGIARRDQDPLAIQPRSQGRVMLPSSRPRLFWSRRSERGNASCPR